MYIASIDCGTTNSRVYIINQGGEIIGKGTREVGVRNTSMSGSKESLKKGLKEAFFDAVKDAELEQKDISFAVSAGMITAEIGLIEIPHLTAPVSLEKISSNIVKVHDTTVFPVDIPIYFIPGIKNNLDFSKATIKDVIDMDFMRGEEVQVMGLLSNKEYSQPLTTVVLSSHTKFISVNKQGEIDGSLTTLSGQVYKAILKETFLGKSIEKTEGMDEPQNFFKSSIIESAFEAVKQHGFVRSLLLTRFMDVLIDTTWYERRLFIETLIAADDMKALNNLSDQFLNSKSNVILVGAPRRCKIYKYILENILKCSTKISTITDEKEIDSLNIKGTIEIVRKGAILQ